MGFLWFGRPAAIRTIVTVDEATRYRHFAAAVADDRANSSNVLVLAHWKETLLRAAQCLHDLDIPYEVRTAWTRADTETLCGPPTGRVLMALAASLPAAEAPSRPKDPAAHVAVRLLELHVLPDANARVTRFVQQLPAKTDLCAFLSFEDPLMRLFAQPWVASMLQAMGLREGGAIDNPMVSRGLQRAVAKLSKRVEGNQPADSMAEWVRINMRAAGA